MEGEEIIRWVNASLDRCRALIHNTPSIQAWKEAKEDGQHIVTNIDIEIEKLLKAAIQDNYPNAGILAEEISTEPAALREDLCFVIDPIDGTQALVEGHSGFAISIAVLEFGQARVGVLDFPARGQRFQAVRDKGAIMNGAPLKVSMKESIAGARIAVSSTQSGRPVFSPIRERLKESEVIPMGAITLRLAAVALGKVDAAFQLPLADTSIAIWDFAAAALVLKEAGGRFTGINEEDLLATLPLKHRRGWIATNGLCHREMIELVKGFSPA